jgi:hypothetical protein
MRQKTTATVFEVFDTESYRYLGYSMVDGCQYGEDGLPQAPAFKDPSSGLQTKLHRKMTTSCTSVVISPCLSFRSGC